MIAVDKRFVAALAVSALMGAGAAAAAPQGPAGDREAASALAATPDRTAGGTVFAARAARNAAAERGAVIPLPAGGTFDGVRWEAAGGVVEQAAMDATLAYNAACQWLRAWRDGRDAATALDVLATVGSWPALRGTESGDVLATVAAQAKAGGGELATAVLADCDASHTREVEYAKRLGLTPSR